MRAVEQKLLAGLGLIVGIALIGILALMKSNEARLPDGSSLRLEAVSAGGTNGFSSGTPLEQFFRKTLPTRILGMLRISPYSSGSTHYFPQAGNLAFYFIQSGRNRIAEEEDFYWNHEYRLMVSDGQSESSLAKAQKAGNSWLWIWILQPGLRGENLTAQLQRRNQQTNWETIGTFTARNPLVP